MEPQGKVIAIGRPGGVDQPAQPEEAAGTSSSIEAVSIAERIERASLTRRTPGGRCQSIGCWKQHLERIKAIAKEAGASATFIVSVMQLNFASLSDDQKKDAILGTFGPADRRITTVRAVPEVAAWIRAEAMHAGVAAMRLVAAMVIAWEGLDATERMGAIRAELRREIDRRSAGRKQSAKNGGVA